MNADALTDEAFEAPLAELGAPDEDPAAAPLRWSLAAMVLVILAFVWPLVGSLITLMVANAALSRLARLPFKQRRRIPLHLRRRVRVRAMSAAGFAALFAILWAIYLV